MTEHFEEKKGQKQHVRLKEFGRNTSRTKIPTDSYLSFTNGSIVQKAYRISTNEKGFMLDPSIVEGSENPVYVFGDSFVESTFVPEGQRFTDVLSRKFAEVGHPHIFYNGGYSGATSLNLFNSLVNKVGDTKNASIILVLPSNDTLALMKEGGFWDFSSQRYSPILPINGDQSENVPLLQNLNQLEAVLKSYVRWADAFKLKLFFATTPFVSTAYENLPWFLKRYKRSEVYEQLIKNRRKSNDVMRSIAQVFRIELIELETIVSNNAHFYDDLHLNETGSTFVASALFEKTLPLLSR